MRWRWRRSTYHLKGSEQLRTVYKAARGCHDAPNPVCVCDMRGAAVTRGFGRGARPWRAQLVLGLPFWSDVGHSDRDRSRSPFAPDTAVDNGLNGASELAFRKYCTPLSCSLFLSLSVVARDLHARASRLLLKEASSLNLSRPYGPEDGNEWQCRCRENPPLCRLRQLQKMLFEANSSPRPVRPLQRNVARQNINLCCYYRRARLPDPWFWQPKN